MKITIKQAGIIFAIFISISALKSDTWYHYTSSAGKYAIDFPGKPTESVTELPSAKSTAYLAFYKVKKDDNSPNIAFGIGYNDADVSESLTSKEGRDKYFRTTIDGSAKRIKGTLTSEAPYDLKGVPGRKAEVSFGGDKLMIEYVLIKGSRVYSLLIFCEAPKKDNDDQKKFLGSFSIKGISKNHFCSTSP